MFISLPSRCLVPRRPSSALSTSVPHRHKHRFLDKWATAFSFPPTALTMCSCHLTGRRTCRSHRPCVSPPDSRCKVLLQSGMVSRPLRPTNQKVGENETRKSFTRWPNVSSLAFVTGDMQTERRSRGGGQWAHRLVNTEGDGDFIKWGGYQSVLTRTSWKKSYCISTGLKKDMHNEKKNTHISHQITWWKPHSKQIIQKFILWFTQYFTETHCTSLKQWNLQLEFSI